MAGRASLHMRVCAKAVLSDLYFMYMARADALQFVHKHSHPRSAHNCRLIASGTLRVRGHVVRPVIAARPHRAFPCFFLFYFFCCSFVLFFWSVASRPGAISSGLTLSGATGAAIGAGSGTCSVLVWRLVDVAGLIGAQHCFHARQDFSFVRLLRRYCGGLFGHCRGDYYELGAKT